MNGVYIIFIMLIFVCKQSLCKNIPKIGIVGAGIGGTSTAFFLRKLFGSDGAVIDIYETNEVGGRLATTTIDNYAFETGGSVIHPRNKYMLDFMKLLNLKQNDKISSTVGLYNGDKFVFETSQYYLITAVKTLWRYGFDLIKMNSIIDSILNEFDRIYELQHNGESYLTVKELLKAMSPSFVNALKNSTYDTLKLRDLSDTFINEIVQATLRVNYGQDINAPFFVGSVSVAGSHADLFSIKGGNKQVPINLLQLSNVTLIPGEVRNIIFNKDLNYLLNYTVNNHEIPAIVERTSSYDIIILATPLTSDMKHKIRFKNFNNQIQFNGKYHRTVCTIVEGELNFKYFNLLDKSITDIISINNQTFFNSISIIPDVNHSKLLKINVWKIFSSTILTDNQLNLLFVSIKNKNVFNWLAYPDYHVNECHSNDNFVLHDYIFHVNAIEWAASAMEMSAIGAKNVALLAYKAWNKHKLPSELFQSIKRQHNEL